MDNLPDFVVPEGMPRSIFDSKYSRRKPDGTMQSWVERVEEVVAGNFAMEHGYPIAAQWAMARKQDYDRTLELARAGIFCTSGRHLQHGDLDQPNKVMELFTNCSTALFSFMMFRLLLRGSGVGRDYSSECCRVDWDMMPDIRLVLDESHPDYREEHFRGAYESLRNARHKYDSGSEEVRWFVVEDTREGWAKCVEILETAAWQRRHEGKLFIFDLSQVRCAGSPIMGLQGRPASGPLALMHALAGIASIKNAGMKPWKQALFVDHYVAACVQLGGARRAARMATKHWRDRDIMEFIDIKRGGFLWSTNNSILVDAEFWEQARRPQHTHARRVFEAAVNAAYWDGTGEPGFINVDKMNDNRHGMELITSRNYISKYAYPDLHPRTSDMIDNVLSHVMKLPWCFIVNPCGEIVLATYGAYCLVGDVCLAYVTKKSQAIDAVMLMSKFLVRCNLMKCDYQAEVARTNRIGTSLIGIHEFAWNLFGLTFHDMISYYDVAFGFASQNLVTHKAHEFWQFIGQLRHAAEFGALRQAERLNMAVPHTVTTEKPGGTVAKVMACTEGAHLPALRHYLRWVQYKVGDAALDELVSRGYPAKNIGHRYPDYWVVGFPTKQRIVDLMGADNVVTADDTTPEENFKWLRLLEKFWLGGERNNNQISYTLKYDMDKVSYLEFMEMILRYQPSVRCCTVMPQSDWRKSEVTYGYVPEEPISEVRYNELMLAIKPVVHEGYDDNELACEAGACPIEPDMNEVTLGLSS